jgi:hypothetical protein
LDFHAQLAKRPVVKLARPIPLAAALLVSALAGGAVYAQLEGADRGVPPIDSASTFEITGVTVDTTGKTAQEAREEGWRQAQSKGWKALWAKTNNRPVTEAPDLPESTLNGMVSGIIVEQEQIGPNRYIATLGVLFDRARSGQLLGASGPVQRSAPMLVVPVMITGSSFQTFESRNEWQKAWARFRTVNSPVDYVRTTGSGIDPLLLNAAQTRRPGRGWWRMLLDQYGAADVVMPEVHLRRSFPGGPARATFTARHGPDNRLLGRFTLRVSNGAALPRMLDEGVRRLDAIYAEALAAGARAPDPSLIVPEPPPVEEFLEEEEVLERPRAERSGSVVPSGPLPTYQAPSGATQSFTIQVPTADAAAVAQAEIAVSRVPGVTSAITSSQSLGGTSTMRVTFTGDGAALAAALQAQGWNVSGSGTSLRISR